MKKIITLFLAVAVLFIFAGCKSTAPTKDDYVKATVEFVCYSMENPSFAVDEAGAMAKLKEIFKKYNFPADNEEAMNVIIEGYREDQSVGDAVSAETQKCAEKMFNQQIEQK